MYEMWEENDLADIRKDISILDKQMVWYILRAYVWDK